MVSPTVTLFAREHASVQAEPMRIGCSKGSRHSTMCQMTKDQTKGRTVIGWPHANRCRRYVFGAAASYYERLR